MAAPDSGDICAHFETGAYQGQPAFLDDASYARALDTFVKGCADVLLVDDASASGEVLLGLRRWHPQPHWWLLGGRMRPGLTPQQQAQHNVRRETGLDLPPERFEQLCVASLLWQRRRQPPADGGTADIAVVFACRVTPEERARVALAADEYRGAAWVAAAAVAGSPRYHPALRRAAQQLEVRRRHQQMEAAAAAAGGSGTTGDAALAAAARAYLAALDAARRIAAEPVAFVDVDAGGGEAEGEAAAVGGDTESAAAAVGSPSRSAVRVANG